MEVVFFIIIPKKKVDQSLLNFLFVSFLFFFWMISWYFSVENGFIEVFMIFLLCVLSKNKLKKIVFN